MHPNPEPAIPERAEDPSIPKILIVDDDQAVRDVMTFGLTDAGYQVTGASRARQALDLPEISEFSLVLLDLRLPGMDGMEFFRILARRHPALGSRVIFMTGDTAGEHTERFLEHAGRPVLAKPFSLDALRTLVEAELEAGPSDGPGPTSPAID